MNLGERIKKIRKKTGLTQKEFGEKLFVSASYISKLEAGKEIPSDMLIRLVAREFGKREEWIITGDGLESDDESYLYEKSLNDESITKTFSVFLGLLKTESSVEYAHYSMIFESLARLLVGYDLFSNSSKKILYLEKLNLLMSDIERFATVSNRLASRNAFETDVEETARILSHHQSVICDDLNELAYSLKR